ncbi:universal stress protein [Nocardioides jishulii]|uniref:Universal stress protein n=1 Tax=Nocardioides jishulii TaxID=2575440 RepID=A0A4U2YML0_9ACTN|nr:universal stress protein [Nocardioides jishulii]QCX27670.1 universal stress protein [Nocardioides jishulii]TKI62477.1 universal stress protein [Nocardioides jishulii]
MVTSAHGPVVVGISDTEDSTEALDWASSWAAATGRPLRLVHARDNARGDSTFADARSDGTQVAESRRTLFDNAANRVLANHPDVSVTVVESGDTSSVLLAQSQEASVLVVGSRRGAVGWSPAGAIHRSVMRQADCPVVVVRDPPARSGLARRVVLGVDGTLVSRGAAEFAFYYASTFGLPVVVVHCSLERWARGSAVLALLSRSDQHGPTAEERLLVAETIAGLADQYPDVEHRAAHRSGRPADELIDLSRSTQLLVLGARRRRGVLRLLHRSVSSDVAMRAQCPVAVVSAI